MNEQAANCNSQPIGEDNGIVRVLNFAGGGFDTVMQLGVTHSLLVSQGKAPDVVVGVSAGAIEAAALAEVIRAGSLPVGEVTDEDYAKVLDKRVQRFRQFSDACHNAPESVVDTVIPDAYQVDSFEPLASLRLPRLSKEERDERDESIQRRAGLVRLYNDLLTIDLPFGAMTRIVRRYLGMKAATAIANPIKRITMQVLEILRMWLVIGTELRRLTPIVPVLVSPLIGRKLSQKLSTAGSIIFKFRPVVGLMSLLRRFWSFLFLVSFWVVISVIVMSLPLLPALIYDARNAGSDTPIYVYLFLALYALPMILPLTPIAIAYDRTGRLTAAADLGKGVFAFFFYLIKWALVLALILLSAILLVQIASSPITDFEVFGNQGIDHDKVLKIAFVVMAVVVIVRPIFWMISASISYRTGRSDKQTSRKRWYVRRFLDHYGLGPALAHNYNLKKLLVGLFDSRYYGTRKTEDILSESLTDKDPTGYAPDIGPNKRKLSFYSTPRENTRDPKIHVAVTAADVRAGDMHVMSTDTPIVDSLLAATAITPVFPPIRIDKQLLVDAYYFGNAPTKALVELFQDRGLADIQAVHIYAVDPLPISRKELGPYAPVAGQPYVNLIDIVMRALQLQRFRDAKLERKLTKRVTWTLPDGQGTVKVRRKNGVRKYFRAYFAPVELEHASNLNRKILFGSKKERRTAISEAIASGCRASLKVMHARVLRKLTESKKTRKKYRDEMDHGFIKCRDLIHEVNKRRKISVCDVPLKGSNKNAPGLAEICRHCHLKDATGEPLHKLASRSISLPDTKERKSERDDESVSHDVAEIDDWPHELAETAVAAETISATAVSRAEDSTEHSPNGKDNRRPTVACLFSGGVFRGVFQLGTLNALSMLGVRPGIVAGASVGSITAAMVASALVEKSEVAKKLKVATLASVYVAIDRIILTDRFSDFIRNWTIRASEAKFSLQQMDRVFRKYDQGRAMVFQRDLRQVLAGIERLFYVNPYQVNNIARLIRNHDGIEASEQLKQSVQQWLDRMDVGEEVLGAEPIQGLIEDLVIPKKHERRPDAAPFNCIDDELTFLATTTNLTRGSLRVLDSRDPEQQTTLIDGLLASSAFPGVFRPRQSWDLEPGTNKIDQYIDGGVMDNLPLHSVLKTMRVMADENRIPLQSTHGPHLMLAASLEVDTRDPSDESLENFERYWPEMASRASELKYNTKIDMFERVLANMQDISEHAPGGRTSMNVTLLAVKPRWLCNSFAFHPMLGFRRDMQAQSIAHGCATTLLAFGQQREIAAGWMSNADVVPGVANFETALPRLSDGKGKKVKEGRCWLQDETLCPFSNIELNKYAKDGLDDNTRGWLERIHTHCWERATHMPR